MINEIDYQIRDVNARIELITAILSRNMDNDYREALANIRRQGRRILHQLYIKRKNLRPNAEPDRR